MTPAEEVAAIARLLDEAMEPGGPGLIWDGLVHRFDNDGRPVAAPVLSPQPL